MQLHSELNTLVNALKLNDLKRGCIILNKQRHCDPVMTYILQVVSSRSIPGSVLQKHRGKVTCSKGFLGELIYIYIYIYIYTHFLPLMFYDILS